MILGAITDWVYNFFWDSVNEFLIAILDNIFYSLMGFLYKVFLVIGSFDLFGGFSSGTDKAMYIYQTFTKRIYSVIGIVVMFILAYQIILFVIDPDKGLKESKKLVTNIVKGIILTVIAPLVFHYLAQIQYHVLVSDNIIWNIVLGEGASGSDNVVEAGNTMASMLFVSVFHPVGTEYSDFYDTSGSLNSPSDACKPYKDAVDAVGDDGYMTQDTLSRTFRNAGLGLIIAGPVGAAIGAIHTWITDEANKTYTCDYYYWILYQAGLKKDEVQDVKPNEVSSITNYSDSTAGFSNKARYLAPNTPLIDEIAQENHMEYYKFSFIGAIAICFFLVAYTLDISVRVFKLAFLQMIAPVPILLGTIPKNEKLYSSWKDHFIKTYIDVFVRVFVMAFIALMVKLIPAFRESLVSVFTSTVGGEEASTGMLNAVTFFALVLGLLRAGQEIPNMLKDLAKNAGGLLQGIDINPLNSYKKSSKPMGAVAGAGLGMAAGGINTFKRTKGQGKFSRFKDTVSGAVRGTIAGAKSGYNNGFGKGAMTKTVSEADDSVKNQFNKRDTFVSALKDGRYMDALEVLDGGKFSRFRSAFSGDMETNKEYFRAGQEFDKVGRAGKLLYSTGMEAFKKTLNDSAQYAIDNMTSSSGKLDFENQTYIGSSFQEIVSNLKNTINKEYMNAEKKALHDSEVINADGTRSYTYNGKTYTSKSNSTNDIRAIKESIRNDIKSNMNFDKKMDDISKLSENDFQKTFTTSFAGKEYSGTYDEIKSNITSDIKSKVAAKEISNTATTISGQTGDEIVSQYAKEVRDVISGWGPVLSQAQRESIDTDIRKSLESSDMLKQALNISDVSTVTAKQVMERIQDSSFANYKNNLSDEDKQILVNELSKTLNDTTSSLNKIAESTNILKSVSDGVSSSRFGTTDYALSNSSSNKDKK